MFKLNDVVVYETAGVCKVVKIGTVDFIANGAEYYTLESLENSSDVFYVKVENEKKIRYTITDESAKEYMTELSSYQGIYNDNSKLREKEYVDILKNRQWEKCLMMFKGIQEMKVQKNSEGKSLSTNDHRSMIKVDKIICGEFSIALGITIDEVRSKLIQACG